MLVVGANFGGQQYGGSFSNDLSVANTDAQTAHDTLVTKFSEMSGMGCKSSSTTPEV